MRSTALVLATVLAGCSEAPTTSTCVPVPGIEECETPPDADEIVAGVNLTALFADATADEIAAASEQRPSSRSSARTFIRELSPAADGARQLQLLLQSNDRDTLAIAVARVPGPPSAVTQLPAVVILTDGEDGASADDALTGALYQTLAEQTVQVVIAYRGEALRVGDASFASDTEADPYRADVADALALLGAIGFIPRVDVDRLGVVGIGRGGTVALLTSLVDLTFDGVPSVDAVVTLGAPTDLLGASFRDDVRTLLQGRSVQTPYPAFEAFAAPVLALRDGAIDTAEARLRLLSLSPGYFGADLPAVLAFHAVGDDVVGDDQLTRLDATMTSEPGVPRMVQRIEGVSHETLADDLGVQRDLAAFLLDVL